MVPALMLAGLALGLRGRERVPAEQFGFTVAQVKFERLLSPAPKNWRMEVTIYIGHKGVASDWWGQPGTDSAYLIGERVIGRNGKIYVGASATSGWGKAGPFDEIRQQYVLREIINTGEKRSVMQPATFKAILAVQNYATKQTASLPISQVIKED